MSVNVLAIRFALFASDVYGISQRQIGEQSFSIYFWRALQYTFYNIKVGDEIQRTPFASRPS